MKQPIYIFTSVLLTQILIGSISLASSMSCESVFTLKPTIKSTLPLPKTVDNYIYWTINGQAKSYLTDYKTTIIGDMTNAENIGFVQLNSHEGLKFQRQVYTGSSYSLFRDRISTALDKVFTTYAKRKIIPEGAISELKSIEEQLPKNRCIYFVSKEPLTGDPLEVIRVLDASPRNKTFFKKGYSPDQQSGKLPIELEYPHIQLKERLTQRNPYLVELGRLVKTEQITEDNLDHIFGRVAEFLIEHHNLNQEETTPIIYIEATRVGRKLYHRYGFTDAVTPDILGLPDRYILRMSSRDFVNHFANKVKNAGHNIEHTSLASSMDAVANTLATLPSSVKAPAVLNVAHDFRGRYYEDIMSEYFNEKVYFQAEDLYKKYFAKVPDIRSNSFWNDFDLAQSKILINDPEYLHFINQLSHDLPNSGTALLMGVNDINLATQVIEKKTNLQTTIYTTTNVVLSKLKPLINDLFPRANPQIIESDRIENSPKNVTSIFLNDVLYKQQSKQDIANLLSSAYSRLDENGTLIIREPTPREAKKNVFQWYGIAPHTLISKSMASLSDIYFMIFAVEHISNHEEAFNFLTSQQILDMAQKSGFKKVKIEKILLGKEAYIVLKK